MSERKRCLPKREFGVLLHVTSLPGGGSSGQFGVEAYRFVDFLCDIGAGVWQVLPMVPTHPGGSPYDGQSVFAGDESLINLPQLSEEGFLPDTARPVHAGQPQPTASGEALQGALAAICGHLRSQRGFSDEIRLFERGNRAWLPDYALYRVLKELYEEAPWYEWPAPLRDRHAAALDQVRSDHAQRIDEVVVAQYLFWRQWDRLKRYANHRGIRMMGDMPIFPAHDSAEVWSSRCCFQLDVEGRPVDVAGVPPDYFSATGQRWGNPLYDWQRISDDGFRWWIDRLGVQLEHFDLMRLDHFRGFESYWAIPADSNDATRGAWRSGPGDALFAALSRAGFGDALIAEDLGSITPAVEAMRRRAGLPGMRVLQFAFDGDPRNPHLPHNHEPFGVVYTGTHDNHTTVGWFERLDAAQRDSVYGYLGLPREEMPWVLVRTAMASVCRLAMLPMQDVLGLDDAARMNIPGTENGNWRWRFDWTDAPGDCCGRLRHMAALYGRSP